MKRNAGPTVPGSESLLGGRKRLLADERVRDWYEDKAKRSRLSAVTNVRKLDFLLERIGLSLDEIEAMARRHPEELRRRLNRYATMAKDTGKLDTYVRKVFHGLRTYFKFRKITFTDYPELDTIEGASIATEKVPTQEELGLILERLSPRGRVVALLMAHAGVRPQVIGAYEGARGLVLGDLEITLSPELSFNRIPFAIRGRAELAKRRKSWTTFGTRQLATAIMAYLSERRERGEVLRPESPLVTQNAVRGVAARSKENARSQLGFLTTTHVVLEVANILHATAPRGVRRRPYALRGFFSTALLRASVDRDFREALLAHDTGVAGVYNVGKPWSDDLLDKARREYARAAEFLETHGRSKADIKTELLTNIAEAVERATGKKTDSTLRGDDLAKAIREALLGANADAPTGLSKYPLTVPLGRVGEQKVIDTEAVESYLGAGWTFRSPLNASKAVVEWSARVRA